MKRHILPTLLLLTISLALYANTLKNGFVFDDEYTIVNNTLIKDLNNLPKLFSKDAYFTLSGEQTYRPVVTFTYFIDYALYGLNPWGFHLTNILLHAVNGVLLYIFVALINTMNHRLNAETSSLYLNVNPFTNQPFLIALLFITHPVLTEAINAPSFREDLLTVFFYMSAFNLYLILRTKCRDIHGRSISPHLYYIFSCILYLLALFSKEMSATLPIIICCYEWIHRDKKEGNIGSIVFNHYNLGYIVILLFYIYISSFHFHNLNVTRILSWGSTERLLAVPWLILSYLKLIIFPISLSADYLIEQVKSPFSIAFLGPIIMLSIAAFLMSHKNIITFGIAFFIIALAPVYNVIHINIPFAERYLYLPIVGFVLIAGSSIYRLLQMPASKTLSLLIVVSIVSIQVVSVIGRSKLWENEYLLLSDTLRKAPKSVRAHFGLGYIYHNKGQLDEAMREYLIVLKLNPNDSIARYNLGLIYYEKGLLGEALQQFKVTSRLKPNDPNIYNNIGLTYEGMNKFEEAIQWHEVSIGLDPDNPRFHNNLGFAYYKLGLIDKASQEFKIALELQPDYTLAYNNLQNVYDKQKMLKQDIQQRHTSIP